MMKAVYWVLAYEATNLDRQAWYTRGIAAGLQQNFQRNFQRNLRLGNFCQRFGLQNFDAFASDFDEPL